MANVLIGKIEVALEDVLHFFQKAEQIVLKGPKVISAVVTLFSAIEKVVVDASVDISNPATLINVPLDIQQFNDVKAVWPDIKAILISAGIKFPS